MSYTYSIYPSVGVARVGNSENRFFLAPDQLGGLPIDCDANGNEQAEPFTHVKDWRGKVKRQGQKFRIYRKNSTLPDSPEEELTLNHPDIESIQWTVHLANKKAAWYKFSEYKGNLLFENQNSYRIQGVDFRNSDVFGDARQSLIIDPGPRTISGINKTVEISRHNIPSDYKRAHFPPANPKYGDSIHKLGDLKTDNAGRLVVLGGFGKSGGEQHLSKGDDTWYDDISDGSVLCTLTLKNGEVYTLKAWAIVGPPDFDPDLTNISTWDDTMFDVGVRHFNLVPKMYQDGVWLEDFRPNYQRDILPIVQRVSRYHWVVNLQSMLAFSYRIFDFSDPSEANRINRQQYLSYFRQSEIPECSRVPETSYSIPYKDDASSMTSLEADGALNIRKFLTVTQTQYFLLKQWAEGKFTNEPNSQPYPGVDDRNRVSVANVVGLPQCPGLEIAWTKQNPQIYEGPYLIQHKEIDREQGLSPSRDECKGGGCEPGDLTKRMAIPWQADFFSCSIQRIDYNELNTNGEGNSSASLSPTQKSILVTATSSLGSAWW